MGFPFLKLTLLSKRPHATPEILTGHLQALMDLDAVRAVTSPRKAGILVRFSRPGTGGPQPSRPTWPRWKRISRVMRSSDSLGRPRIRISRRIEGLSSPLDTLYK